MNTKIPVLLYYQICELKLHNNTALICVAINFCRLSSFSAIYERSCEAFRKTGSQSGVFTIDLDGSGPLEYTQVNCTVAGTLTMDWATYYPITHTQLCIFVDVFDTNVHHVSHYWMMKLTAQRFSFTNPIQCTSRCDLSMCGGMPGGITQLIKWVQHLLLRLSGSAGWIRVGQPSFQGASGDFCARVPHNIPDSARQDPTKRLISVT